MIAALLLFAGGPIAGIKLSQAVGQGTHDGTLQNQLTAERSRRTQMETVVKDTAQNLRAIESSTTQVEQRVRDMATVAQRLSSLPGKRRDGQKPAASAKQTLFVGGGSVQPLGQGVADQSLDAAKARRFGESTTASSDATQLQDRVKVLESRLGNLVSAVDQAAANLTSLERNLSVSATASGTTSAAPEHGQPATNNDGDKAAAQETPAPAPSRPDTRTAEQKAVVALWPIDDIITSPFGNRPDPWGNGTGWHGGMDIRAAIGTPVKAAQSGTVISVGWQAIYGLAVEIQQDGGWMALYGHNSEVKVNVGDVVKAGDIISLSGDTGPVTGPHLHFELRKDGQQTDPMPYMPPGEHGQN